MRDTVIIPDSVSEHLAEIARSVDEHGLVMSLTTQDPEEEAVSPPRTSASASGLLRAQRRAEAAMMTMDTREPDPREPVPFLWPAIDPNEVEVTEFSNFLEDDE